MYPATWIRLGIYVPVSSEGKVLLPLQPDISLGHGSAPGADESTNVIADLGN
jgi:hypothetical protein